MNHETFIQRVRDIALERISDPEQRAALESCKLVYGAGSPSLRGVTYYQRWQAGESRVPFVEVCAFGESDFVQLAGTTLHELGHVLAGFAAAHGKDWHHACALLGLRHCKAAGYRYMPASFAPDVRHKLAALVQPTDGTPNPFDVTHPQGFARPLTVRTTPRPCATTIGAHGGTSRGKGSGSRLRKLTCECGMIVRASAGAIEEHGAPEHCGHPMTSV